MLRVVTWNIRTGGRDRAGPDRWDRLVRVVVAQRPDVLALQELRGFDDGGVADRFAGAVGLRAYLARSCFGQPVAVLVRPEWRVLAAGPVRRPFHHGAQRVTLATAAGPLTVLSTHLDPYRGWRRRIEAGWLAAAVRRSPGTLALLGGDLNTLEPDVDHTARIARLPAAYRRRHLRRDGRAETRAVARLYRAGLVDLFGRAGTGPPETAPTRHGGGVEFSGMRLDYLLGTTALAGLARDCRVVRGGDTEYASDHYPVAVDLDLTPA
ncbi:endonuclease/exonuclease/phosphatase family protein [Micromonospora cathayae]|uniref:Endonuclease/exonuclease/phosphatase family protein n=1 Tax=Micromonospora cathayae TaxID=3028804 RepID=A0ABY7ZZ97_9ACTN|nr:endonuclease/exonuclease/phosphatase family protein [Micromonospora sp. HUAS 3]WDZ87716.1 endonuclease/exonuclease/phosphatase family protein [Micromonospora sp. HUAS 3]